MPTFQLTIRNGSITEFFHAPNPKLAAIVNAANQSCIGGGGLDGAIAKAGGPKLMNDRLALPYVSQSTKIRCLRGQAKVTGPNRYGSLRVPYVIHAVGADYQLVANTKEGDDILRSAYRESLKIAKSLKLEAIAFPLLSSGVFRGSRKVEDVIRIGIESIRSFPGYPGLQEVSLYAFGDAEFRMLLSVSSKMKLSVNSVSYSIVVSNATEREQSCKKPATMTTGIPAAQHNHLQPSDIAQLKRVEQNFHGLIRQRNKGNPNLAGFIFPDLVELANVPMRETYYPVPGMYGGFDTTLTCSSHRDWKVTCSSWSRTVGGSGQRHEVTKDRITLLQEGFV